MGRTTTPYIPLSKTVGITFRIKLYSKIGTASKDIIIFRWVQCRLRILDRILPPKTDRINDYIAIK